MEITCEERSFDRWNHARLSLSTGRDPFNQNFRAEVRKFLGVKWIATSSNGLVPFHSQNEFRAHLNWRMLDHCCSYYFDGDINDIPV